MLQQISCFQCKLDYPLRHSESFHPSLLLFLFDWLMKRWEITKVVSINCTYYVMQVIKYMWIWLSVNQPLKLTNPMLILIEITSYKLWWFHVCVFGCYFPVQPALQSLSSTSNIGLFHLVLIQVLNYKICNIFIWTNWLHFLRL